MTAQTAPAMINHRPGLPARGVFKESMIEPESVAEPFHIVALRPLLPVQPPEINALLLQRVQHCFKITLRPFLPAHPERDIFPFRPCFPCPFRIICHKPSVAVLKSLDTRCRVKIEGSLKTISVEKVQSVFRIGKEVVVPCITGPSLPLPGSIQRRIVCLQPPG